MPLASPPMRWSAAHLRFLLVIGFVHVLVGGCSNHSRFAIGRAETRPEPRMAPDGESPSRSDRLRGDLISTSTSEPEPTLMQQRPQRQDMERPAPTPLRGGAEPDPRDVIDWLLKERR